MPGGQVIKLVGLIVVAVSIFYVGDRIAENFQDLLATELYLWLIPVLVVEAIAYAVILTFVSGAWWILLTTISNETIGWVVVFGVYGRSQIAKYLPTNLFHFAGRQVLGQSIGCPQIDIAGASILETGMMVMVALVAGIVFLPVRAVTGILESVETLHWVLVFGFLAVAGGGLLLARYIPWARRWLKSIPPRLFGQKKRLLAVFALYSCFFILTGLILWSLLGANGVYSELGTVPITIGAFALAWVLGFILPGAPGGLGVREAVLVVLLSPFFGETQALAAGLCLRIVTLLGDVAHYLAALAVSRIYGNTGVNNSTDNLLEQVSGNTSSGNKKRGVMWRLTKGKL